MTAAAALLAYGFGILGDLERQTVDTRFAVRGARTPQSVVLVTIDNATIARLGDWPYPRRMDAAVLDRLREDGARLVAFDIDFFGLTDQRDDLALYDAVKRARGRVVLATSEVGHSATTNVLGGDANVRRAGAVVGDSQLPNDRYAVLRRMVYSVLGLKNFAIIAAEKATGRAIGMSALGGRDAWIDYAGPPRTIRSVPFWRVLRGAFQPGRFRDRVVVVGASAPAIGDIHATPTSGNGLMSGVEVQANQIRTAMRGFPLQSVSRAVEVLLVLLLALTVPLVSIRGSPLLAGVAAVVVGALFTIGTQVAFDHGAVLSFVYPLGALVVSLFGALGLHYVLVEVDRERVHNVFSRFVPEQVIDQVLAQTNEDLRLGGRKVEATVMFCDLRSFTSTVEHLAVETVIDLLNRYFEEMSEAILGNGGTLVSYIGDGIMAVFGAPIDQPDHARRALAAACEILDVRLPRFNEWLTERGLGEAFKMGIGLNTGLVMAGNVGSARRLEYTAVGDTVNTASRLEGLTKGTPYSLFVGESTYALLGDEAAELEYIDERTVRGRRQMLRIWGRAAAAPPIGLAT